MNLKSSTCTCFNVKLLLHNTPFITMYLYNCKYTTKENKKQLLMSVTMVNPAYRSSNLNINGLTKGSASKIYNL